MTLSCKAGSMRLRLWMTLIFPCFLLLLFLPCCSSTFRQNDDDKTQHDPEDHLLFSRIQSLHRRLAVDFHDEEDGSVSSTLDNRWANIWTMTLTDNKRREWLRKNEGIFNAWWLMHWPTDFPSVSGHFTHYWAFHCALRVTNSIVVAAPIYSNSDLYANSL